MSNRYPGQSAAANVHANNMRAQDRMHYYRPATPKVVPFKAPAPVYTLDDTPNSSSGLTGGEMAGLAALIVIAVTGAYYLYKSFRDN